MIIPGSKDMTLQIMEKNLDLRLKKHQLLVSNIANIDTPGYKPFNIVVRDAFEKMDNHENTINLEISNPLHITAKEKAASTIEVKEEGKQDIDTAMSELSRNTMLYNATAQILSKKYQMLKQSITGGRQ